MQVQRITNESYKPNFKSLKILYPEEWDVKLLNEFVHNLEIQKFVKYYHDQNINIGACSFGTLGISMYKYTGDLRDRKPFVTILEGLKSFNAAEVISMLKQVTQEKIDKSQLLKQAQEFVADFNKALAESKNQTSIWKV